MSFGDFARAELAGALARGVTQCVVIGSETALSEEARNMQVISVAAAEPLDVALEKAGFNRMMATFFVWLGDTGDRTAEAVVSSLAFIASLPAGSGVLFDYTVERTAALGSKTQTALDALASQMPAGAGKIKRLVQPQAVAGLLRSLGFQRILDVAKDDLSLSNARVVSAVV